MKMSVHVGSRNGPIGLVSVIFFSIFIAIVGAILLFISSSASKIPPNVGKTSATVSKIEVVSDEYKDYVDYKVDDVDYVEKLMNGYDSNLKVGDPVEITYSIDKPDEPSLHLGGQIETFKYVGITLCGFAIWLVITGSCITVLKKL